EAWIGTERIGYFGQRLAEMLSDHLLVGDVVGHFAQRVHVVGECNQPRLDAVPCKHAKGMAHHGGARDLAERADMRQAGWAVAGLENDLVLRLFLQPRDNLARLLERPSRRGFGERAQLRGIINSNRNRHPARLAGPQEKVEPRLSAPGTRQQSRLPAGYVVPSPGRAFKAW